MEPKESSGKLSFCIRNHTLTFHKSAKSAKTCQKKVQHKPANEKKRRPDRRDGAVFSEHTSPVRDIPNIIIVVVVVSSPKH